MQLVSRPLRLPRSLKAGIERIGKRDHTSMNQFIAMVAAEKLATIEAADFFTSGWWLLI
jgi:hypothetical protein